MISNLLQWYSFLSVYTGVAILNGFFASKQDILVPVKSKPSITQLSVLPSSKAYLTYSKQIHSFLSLPLIPCEFSKNGLFNELKQRALIQETSLDLIQRTISQCNLEAVELIELLHWLCTSDINNNKQFIKRIFSSITFRDNESSKLVNLKNIEFYTTFNVSSFLPLPANVLPVTITSHISNDDLSKKLLLKIFTFDALLDFYCLENQRNLLLDSNTVVCVFILISKHWTQIDKSKWETVKKTLSTIECIPTTQGMKIPKESYIRSPILSSDLSIITLNVVESMARKDDVDGHADILDQHLDDRVLAEFLKSIGCRTINIQSFINHQNMHSGSSLSSTQSLQMLIKHLLDEKSNMSNEDIEALKHSQCFPGQ